MRIGRESINPKNKETGNGCCKTWEYTNIVYFGLPKDCKLSKEEFTRVLKDEYGVLVGYGYSRGGELFRACTHIDVDGKDVDHAIESILAVQAR